MEKPNKRLGQHFLVSPGIVAKIINAAGLTNHDTVLEVGPGRGILTEELVRHAKKVIAVEKDPKLAKFLKEKYSGVKKLEVIEGDILKIPGSQHAMLLPKKYKIVANIPYYITSRFLRIFLEEAANKPELMVLLVQKEVAERIIAIPPNGNLLGISVQAYGRPAIIARVPKGNFNPPPRIDSAVIQISNISGAFFKKNSLKPAVFFAFARKAFSQKRKMLRKSLGLRGDLSTKRPQDLSLEDWITILRPRSPR